MRYAAITLAVFAGACSGGTTSVMDMSQAPAMVDGWSGTLDVDIRWRADVVVVPGVGDAIDVRLTLSPGQYGAIDPGAWPSATLRGTGRLARFPEADTDLYTVQFPTVTGLADGLCKGQPVSPMLSLARREGNSRVAGGLSLYCGTDVRFGRPARILRLSGPLQRARVEVR